MVDDAMARNSGVCFEREIVNSATVSGVTVVKVPVGYAKNARFAGGGSVDFLGVIRGVPVALEAKSCRGERFSLNRITDRQLEFMRRWESSGGKAAVLLRFGFRQVCVVVIPFFLIQRWKLSGKRSVTMRDVRRLPHLPGSAKRWCIECIPELMEGLDGELDGVQ